MITKKNLKIAGSLAKQSLDKNGWVSELKVRHIVSQISKQKPQQATSILKTYRRLIESMLAKEEVVIESPVKISLRNLENELIKKIGAKKVIYKINPDLVFGAKITHGDWVFEKTLDSKLKQLTNI